MAKKLGRPSEFKKKSGRLLEQFKEGALSVGVARSIAGVSMSQWRDWKRKGRAGEPGYKEWWEDVERARGNICLVAEQTIHQAVESGSTVDAWRVLRVHGPDEYRGDGEGETEDSRMTAYVPGAVDDQVEMLQKRLMRVLAVCDELEPEAREKILLALKE